jgi:hypothetical protein
MECQYRPEDENKLSRSSAALFLWILEQYRSAEADSTYQKLYAGMLHMDCLEAFQGVKATKHIAASDGTLSTTAKDKELKRLYTYRPDEEPAYLGVCRVLDKATRHTKQGREPLPLIYSYLLFVKQYNTIRRLYLESSLLVV